jgi:hypothetical protein
MAIIVYNCFHWIGYHYVNFLLEKGKVVVGVDKVDSEKKENLHMMVGRNSSFTLQNRYNPVESDTAVVIGELDREISIDVKRIIQIETTGLKNRLANAMLIKAPILFGEWMDMTEDGIRDGSKIIRFESEEFQTEAVHIRDFIKATYPLLKSTNNTTNINVSAKKILLNESVKLENSIYIRDNIPIEENMKKLLSHYRRFKELY